MTTAETIAQGRALLQSLRPLPASVVEELRHRYEVRLTHHSTAIEGNTLTQSETEIVLEKGITIAGKSLADHLEVVGHKEALDFVRMLASGDEEIGERQIREIHALVMKGQHQADIGAYRTLDVRAAGTDFTYPSHLKVPELMKEFASWLSCADRSEAIGFVTEAHFRFVTIHPFRDGNGRVGRLLMNLWLLRLAYPIAVIPVERRAEYIDALVAAQSGGDLDPLRSLVAESVLAGLLDTLATCASSEEVRAAHPEVLLEVESWLQP